MTTFPSFDYRLHDRKIWDEELEDFVPSRVIDAHAHLFSSGLLTPEAKAKSGFRDTDYATLKSWAATIFPGRETHFLLLATPLPGTDVAAHNRMLAAEARNDPLSRVSRMVTPDNSAEEIKESVEKYGFIGLKPYRSYAVSGDAKECRIHDFFPEHQMEVANELGLWVTLHLSRSEGCRDPMNLRDLKVYTNKRYPKIKWILAHCARSFTQYPIRDGIEKLRDMPNIWYDLSADTEVRTFITLFKKENLKRLFFGTDAIDSTSFHGIYIALGEAWKQLETDKIEQLREYAHCDGRPVLCVYEGMVAIKNAAEIVGLRKSQVEDIFWRNAVRELDIPWVR